MKNRRNFTDSEKVEVIEKIKRGEATKYTVTDRDGNRIHDYSVDNWMMAYELGQLKGSPKPKKIEIHKIFENKAPERNPWAVSENTGKVLRSKLSEYIIKATDLEVENMELRSRLEALESSKKSQGFNGIERRKDNLTN